MKSFFSCDKFNGTFVSGRRGSREVLTPYPPPPPGIFKI